MSSFPLGRRLTSPIGRLTLEAASPRLRLALADQDSYFPWDKPALTAWPEQFALVTEAGEPAFMWANEEGPVFEDGQQRFYRPGQLEVAPALAGKGLALIGMQAIAARAHHLGLDQIAILSLNEYLSPRARPFYSKIGALPYRYETSFADCIPLWIPPEAVAELVEGFRRRLEDEA